MRQHRADSCERACDLFGFLPIGWCVVAVPAYPIGNLALILPGLCHCQHSYILIAQLTCLKVRLTSLLDRYFQLVLRMASRLSRLHCNGLYTMEHLQQLGSGVHLAVIVSKVTLFPGSLKVSAVVSSPSAAAIRI